VFRIEDFIQECQSAVARADAMMSVKHVLDRALDDVAAVSAALPAERAEIVPLHVSASLTVLKVVWAPGMSFRPHNHLMWAAIGLYEGQEDNVFYRRDATGLVESGQRSIRRGEVAVLGPDTIHAVTNPLSTHTGAIHVYGGDLPHQLGRSEWDEHTLAEVDYDFDRTVQYFADANR
jgi:predicted metal-dependent enzyme (double-stranded beta helix superfamily)